ncbi:MAG: hypothetical protein ACOC6H_04305 [Thermoproteota archaeon]
MSRSTLLLLATLLLFGSFLIVSPVPAGDGSMVGVQRGDWIEYRVNITGGTRLPPTMSTGLDLKS